MSENRQSSLRGDQRGFNLISLLLSMGFISFTVLAMISSQSNDILLRKFSDAKSSSMLLMNQLAEHIWIQTNRYLRHGHCNEATFSTYVSGTRFAKDGMIFFMGISPSVATDAPPIMLDAAARCASPRLLSKDASTTYFCVQVLRDENSVAERPDFWGNKASFAEVSIRMKRFSDDASLTCDASVSAAGDTSGEIYISLYWSAMTRNVSRYFSQHRFFMLNRTDAIQ